MATIEWLTSLGYAEDTASATRKPILFYYFDPGCFGCRQMDAVTYPTKEVVQFVNKYLVPLGIEVSKKAYYEKYNVIWTPTFLLLDFIGNEIQRKVGYMNVEDFMAFMHLGIAKVHLNTKEFDAANVHFNRVFNHYPESNAVPEAIFFRGVNLFKKNDDPSQLKSAYEMLHRDHPTSSWAKRATPYQFIS